jgi:hypothetical protein
MLIPKLLFLHYILFQFEKNLKIKNKVPGDLSNRFVSVGCLVNVLYNCLVNIYLGYSEKNVTNFLVKYFVYDLIYMCSCVKVFKSNVIFVIHHLFTMLLLYFGYNLNLGNGIYLIFETTSPLLNLVKISQVLVPSQTNNLKWITKKSYFLLRVICPPFWLFYKLKEYQNTFNHNFVFIGIGLLWQASIVWYRKMN